MDPYAESHQNNSAVTAGSAACAAEDAKRNKIPTLSLEIHVFVCVGFCVMTPAVVVVDYMYVVM